MNLPFVLDIVLDFAERDFVDVVFAQETRVRETKTYQKRGWTIYNVGGFEEVDGMCIMVAKRLKRSVVGVHLISGRYCTLTVRSVAGEVLLHNLHDPA